MGQASWLRVHKVRYLWQIQVHCFQILLFVQLTSEIDLFLASYWNFSNVGAMSGIFSRFEIWLCYQLSDISIFRRPEALSCVLCVFFLSSCCISLPVWLQSFIFSTSIYVHWGQNFILVLPRWQNRINFHGLSRFPWAASAIRLVALFSFVCSRAPEEASTAAR